MKKLFYLGITSLLSLTIACKKEPVVLQQNPEYIEQDNILAQIDFRCKHELDTTIDTYFRGTLNNQPICYYDGVDGQKAYQGLVNVVTSSTPNFSIENSKLNKQFWLGFDRFSLGDPNGQCLQFVNPISGDSTIKGWIEKKIIPNKELLILDRTNSGGAPYDKVDGFIIYLFTTGNLNAIKPGYLGQVSSVAGTQSKKSYFKPISVKKGNINGFEYYDLEFDLRCELYKNRYAQDADALFGVLEGKYHTRLWL